MSTRNPNRPPRRSNSLSLSLILMAVAVFVLVRWSNDGLGALFSGAAEAPTVSTATEPPNATSQPAAVDETAVDDTVDDETPEVQSTTQAQSAATPEATPLPTPTANAPPYEPVSDLPTIAYNNLPPEAHDTIALIEDGGPFPYSRDGITFQNRERILPRKPEGYYREYTVVTPGENDRGARRIVTGEEDEMYYTDDHYESFSEIIPS